MRIIYAIKSMFVPVCVSVRMHVSVYACASGLVFLLLSVMSP